MSTSEWVISVEEGRDALDWNHDDGPQRRVRDHHGRGEHERRGCECQKTEVCKIKGHGEGVHVLCQSCCIRLGLTRTLESGALEKQSVRTPSRVQAPKRR